MSDKEIIDFTERLHHGLDIAERRMLEEKALHGQKIIVCSKEGKICQIPARKAMEKALYAQN
ncbi:MAG: hypothetical protein IKX51_08370 [Bacteroidales bacterium]|nr:hypothetical protein [Bacteroidales bacterium]